MFLFNFIFFFEGSKIFCVMNDRFHEPTVVETMVGAQRARRVCLV
ncbi:hypothetical protein THOM_1892 [Trachipleistophora hominis]|uniref:Uncharacterized protein n=1 Tax=Trachipleistophora hominis TaxID=72359 RepID=L7JWR7_TRAHO|nr:hypothetical protein THOM_1892 [Trachipleistophora hominis]